MTKNFVELIGFAGQEPKRIGSGDTAPVKLSLATNERWKDTSGERQERTEWHTAIFWGRLAEVAAKYIKKGSHVLVTGSLKSRQYEDDDGLRHTVWEIHVRDLLLLDPRTSSMNEADESPAKPETPVTPVRGQGTRGNGAGNPRPRVPAARPAHEGARRA